MAIVFTFLLLAALYESWSLPFAVLLGTPLVVFGAFLGIWLQNLEDNVFVQVGLVMLVGLAAKNAILIVEFAKMQRERGVPAIDATMAAAKLRFRPILMTAFAFILGVVPLMLATGAGAVSRVIMGASVFWGMLVSTVVGVFIIPGLFVFMDKFTSRKKRALWDAPRAAPEGGH